MAEYDELISKIDAYKTRRQSEISDEDTLYHFTDIRALMSIVENGEMWASQQDFMNDKYETLYPKKVLDNVSAYLDCDMSLFKERLLREWEKLYILSFSLEDESFHQWSCYEKQNDGYCIGIQKKYLVAMFKNNLSFHGKVMYQYKDYKDIFESIIKYLGRRYKEVDHDANKLTGSEVRKIEGYLAELLVFIKLDSYSCENEYRFVFYNGIEDKEKHELCFRSRNGIVVPYLREPFCVQDIDKILIGPMVQDELARDGLSQFLDNFGIHIQDSIGTSFLKIRR